MREPGRVEPNPLPGGREPSLSQALCLSAAVAVLGGLSSACASSTAAGPGGRAPVASDYAPLAVGDSWTYAMTLLGQKGEMTVTVVREEDGYFIDDQKGELRHTADGLRDRNRYMIRHPLVAGSSWKTIISASAVETNEILSVGQPCESASGTYDDCLVVENSIRKDKSVTLHVRWTWARGIGMVKIETEAELQNHTRIPQARYSLVRYTLGGKRDAENAAAAASDSSAPDTWEKGR